MRKAGFPPVVDAATRVLILGSLPGEASLAARQYYGHPRNAFWRLMEGVLDTALVALAYEDRLAALLARRVGLWDVIAEAERPGSLDAAIRDPAANDLLALIDALPALRLVAFNGGTAAKLGGKLIGDRVPTLALPSSSPAHAAKSFEQKAIAWSALRAALATRDA
ncbi:MULTISPECIES: DNA-deoxyinosine glycosylase [Caulobacter]|uniref:G/U mismatch-specific uracil-DNA glycosylase n=1 Tax=Caulobacter vibrioides OR37 TaxID=1292034 RepID=R0D080_CAUVI|nr:MULTISPECIES: DNA-deoxyinosine glycosylase [Caulobacter]ENZ81905.1 G/U mismatch-specific uracil-DNA glycosylase [Caulobacter vibrioides OR37]MBQ1559580.1 DNA-deoxyinosine glycosylase [Caulobacter sp.]